MGLKIALAGNPNCGKTTLFNALTGAGGYVGNWPGVTVEKKEAPLKGSNDVYLTDLPGIYSLSPYSPEELAARSYLLSGEADVIINLIDGTAAERSLFLTTQLQEIGTPMVCAVNMLDELKARGIKINTALLARRLGIPVLGVSALRGDGLEELVAAARESAKKAAAPPSPRFSEQLEACLERLGGLAGKTGRSRRFYALKLFERDALFPSPRGAEELIRGCEKSLGDDSVSLIIHERYSYVDRLAAGIFLLPDAKKRLSPSNKIDLLLTNRLLALPIFAAIMALVYFFSVGGVGKVFSDWFTDGVFGGGWSFFGLQLPGVPELISCALDSLRVAGFIRALVLDGIVAGVGTVLGFLPQLALLFLCLGFLESCGYMARAAFVLDGALRYFGLSGRSFIPMLLGTGCSVPGIMASRAIADEAARRLTIITTGFIPCSAKLPVIALFAGSFFGGAWWVSAAAYLLGAAAVLLSGVLLKKTSRLRGGSQPFVMELPAYRLPSLLSLVRSVRGRAGAFIKKAGGVVLLASVLLWFASGYGFGDGGIIAAGMEDSLLASLCRGLSQVFIPLGWGDWRSAAATLTGLLAKENIVGTLGVLYRGGGLESALRCAYSPAAAGSLLVFNLLCSPCVAAMGAMRRELGSRRWFAAAVLYQCTLAYFAALWVYQLSIFFSGAGFTPWTAAAFLSLAAFVFLLARRDGKTKKGGAALPLAVRRRL
ncbi:MAG: ferrous iron transport protein B [Clostridium sp.]|jgi:ferrous iron transport protein B|nr:ferrous iron transport protein B [Clostridium sp.]